MESRVIRSVLVPNRGEIAVRIARTCREMGVRSILAFAEEERSARPRRAFDEGVSLGEGEATDTYLNVGRILDAARESGAESIHPGYGFLSESAELAAACAEAGLAFIGPSAEAIEAMGSKAGSRALMEKLGVPVVPGYHGEDQSDGRLSAEAERVGFPILVKASAGGGGKGMKIAFTARDLPEAIASARREAAKAFGNDRLLIEKFIEEPRHVEFQVFGDGAGEIVHLYERDCSIQRRHQKVVEETPAPRYAPELRQKMAASAIAAARGVAYRSAGTVEFIVTPGGEHYFLEMNTRLQVEHPVTEMILGVDLVRAQIEVAGGASIPWRQDELRPRGHAIEVRIYAEDPQEGFLPQIGTIRRWEEPSGPGVRVDSGVETGSEITMRWDPMLAKLVAHANDRDKAIDRLIRALDELIVLGTKTNKSWLRRVVALAAFREGKVSTHFLTAHEKELRRVPSLEEAAVAAVLASISPAAGKAVAEAGEAPVSSVWDRAGGWGRT